MASHSDMSKTFRLPLLPGNTCGEELLRRNYRKTQIFNGTGARLGPSHATKSGAPVPADFDSSLVFPKTQGGSPYSPHRGAGSDTIISNTEIRDNSLSRKVLRYFGYFTETVPESAQERTRVRRVVICYFLEDGTMSVSEPREDNSGIAFQGTMVKRHQLPNVDGSPVTYEQLAVGSDINFYGRTYHLVDCDAYTRDFMTSLGVTVAAAESYPSDTYTNIRAKGKERPQAMETLSTALNASGMKVKLSGSEIRATKQFLANDRKVLRLGAVWDDSKALYGSKHFFTVYYFLSDDTIEVIELNPNNSGRDPFPSFCRRRKMVKPRNGATATSTTADSNNFYQESDLRIGAKLWIFGRELLIHKYDNFTADYLQTKFGVTDHTSIDVADPVKPPVARIPPPYNGYGDEQDSLGSWYSLEPKPPRKDESKFLLHGDNVVKFALKLENNVATDEIRKFVLSCYLADDSIAIFEPVQRNSGIVGGKFLQRQKLKNPATGKLYVASDFFVGCHTTINGYPFYVYASDERSLGYMEMNSGTFAASDIDRIVARISAMLKSSSTGLANALQEADAAGTGSVQFKELAGIFGSLNLPVSEQEVLTVLRHFDRSGEKYISYADFISRILPEGSVVGTNSRTWESLFGEVEAAHVEEFTNTRKLGASEAQSAAAQAASGARLFLEAYASRRSLFQSEFRFITDYATDSKIGAKEFGVVVTEKLKLSLSDDELHHLQEKLFPPKTRRVDYEEFLRLMNGTSMLTHNIQQIRDRGQH